MGVFCDNKQTKQAISKSEVQKKKCNQALNYLLDLEEEILLGLLLLAPGAPEVFVVELLVNLDTRQVDLGGGADHVSLVHTTEGNTVDLEGSVHEEEARCQLLQEDNPLAAETTSEEDQDGSWGDVGTELDGGDLVVLLAVGGGRLGTDEAGGLVEGHLALAAVLRASNGLDLGGLLLGLNLGVNLPLVEATLSVHGRPAMAGDSIDELGVPWLGGHC